MATIRPFKAVRPVPEKAADVAALPYDVYIVRKRLLPFTASMTLF